MNHNMAPYLVERYGGDETTDSVRPVSYLLTHHGACEYGDDIENQVPERASGLMGMM